MPLPSPSIHIDPARVIDEVDPRIYSGFTEHMGRCIYGGLYDPENKNGLSDANTGFRKDVMEVLKELKMPLVRYPGGNFMALAPGELRPRRPELAWLTEESNHFGTDEFIQWCREMDVEPFICLNMGTGTLEDALAWLEYCNSSANTTLPICVATRYGDLGKSARWNRRTTQRKLFPMGKALRLLDPSIKLISCGETGCTDWDRVTLKKLAPVVDFHSIHLYTPPQREKAIANITDHSLDLAKIENNLSKELTVCSTNGTYDACIAQSVNVIRQSSLSRRTLPPTTYYPLHLFSNLMRRIIAQCSRIHPVQDLVYKDPTKPGILRLQPQTPQGGQEIRVALLNRHASEEFTVPILFGPAVSLNETVKVYEIWHEDIKATNGFDGEKVKTQQREDKFEGSYKLRNILSKVSIREPGTVHAADFRHSPSLHPSVKLSQRLNAMKPSVPACDLGM
ncbi:glycoside hydrolase family 51 protein [Coprinopsis sp. MPI-PUGE-AT-0042]|nr:glycoside hydrolase family 51 protein [Coprinopsis sp. MPI-PUGE-AT-0042]